MSWAFYHQSTPAQFPEVGGCTSAGAGLYSSIVPDSDNAGMTMKMFQDSSCSSPAPGVSFTPFMPFSGAGCTNSSGDEGPEYEKISAHANVPASWGGTTWEVIDSTCMDAYELGLLSTISACGSACGSVPNTCEALMKMGDPGECASDCNPDIVVAMAHYTFGCECGYSSPASTDGSLQPAVPFAAGLVAALFAAL